MNLGIDIDNVISNFNEELLREYINHDKELRNTGIINENADYIRRGMFDWTEDEEITFYRNNIERIAKNLKVKDGAKEYLDKLIEDGHRIYIITGRDNGEYSEPYNMTKKWLDDNRINYHHLILTQSYRNDKHGKAIKCLENNIDIMIDDSDKICKDCNENNITTVLMDTPYNRQTDITRVHDWKEAYKFISNYKKEKINVILDTDTYNECDDQFALAYMLKSQDVFNIEAITVAPYSHKELNESVEEGQEKSYNEILKICKWLEFDTTNKVFKGSEDYICNGYSENNDAVDKIIEIASKNDKTYIMAIGAITNVALAIKKAPGILEKIEVIWLGGKLTNTRIDDYYIKEYYNYYSTNVAEGLETLPELFNRIHSFLDDIKTKYANKNILLVTHGAVARTIQFYFEEMPTDGMLLNVSGQKNCEIKEYTL